MDIELKATFYDVVLPVRDSHDAISRRTSYLEDTWFFKAGIAFRSLPLTLSLDDDIAHRPGKSSTETHDSVRTVHVSLLLAVSWEFDSSFVL